MRWRNVVFSVVAGIFVLVVWHGLAQFFPWGVPSVRNLSSASEPYVASTQGLRQSSPGTWTTQAFDEEFAGQISTLATDNTFSWIISAPRADYNLTLYFARHVLTQISTAVMILLSLHLLSPLPAPRRWGAFAILSVLAASAIYAGMMNWMSMPMKYGVGQAANHVLGWMLAGAVLDRLLTRSDERTAAPCSDKKR